MPQVSLISPITKQAIGKKKVGIYCRVSSNSADQENSYSKQIHYYTEYAKRSPIGISSISSPTMPSRD